MGIKAKSQARFLSECKKIFLEISVYVANPKLRTANGFSYLIRTVELEPGMKNAVEICVDSIRERRAAYTVK